MLTMFDKYYLEKEVALEPPIYLVYSILIELDVQSILQPYHAVH